MIRVNGLGDFQAGLHMSNHMFALQHIADRPGEYTTYKAYLSDML